MGMSESLRVRVGAVALVLVTFAAIVFAFLNFRQGMVVEVPDDGVTWLDTASGTGVEARYIVPDSPADRAGIKRGDLLVAIDDTKISSATQVARELWRAGVWTEVRYDLIRNGVQFNAPPLVTEPAQESSVFNYLRVAGVVYLFIGVFIFLRRWSAAEGAAFLHLSAWFPSFFIHSISRAN